MQSAELQRGRGEEVQRYSAAVSEVQVQVQRCRGRGAGADADVQMCRCAGAMVVVQVQRFRNAELQWIRYYLVRCRGAAGTGSEVQVQQCRY